MIPMPRIERHYRLTFLCGELDHIKDQLNAIEFAIAPAEKSGEAVFERLESAATHIQLAMEQLQCVPTLGDLETALSLSIAMVKEKRSTAKPFQGES